MNTVIFAVCVLVVHEEEISKTHYVCDSVLFDEEMVTVVDAAGGRAVAAGNSLTGGKTTVTPVEIAG